MESLYVRDLRSNSMIPYNNQPNYDFWFMLFIFIFMIIYLIYKNG